MDPDPDPGGPKTYGSDGFGSATLLVSNAYVSARDKIKTYFLFVEMCHCNYSVSMSFKEKIKGKHSFLKSFPKYSPKSLPSSASLFTFLVDYFLSYVALISARWQH
jgi:hypothetical protein